MNKLLIALGALLLSTGALAAGECNIKIQRDVLVNEQSLQVLGDDPAESGSGYQIYQDGRLRVAGKSIQLNDSDQQATVAFAGEMAALITRWVALAEDALTLASESLEVTLGDALGTDSEVVANATAALELARSRFQQRSQPGDGIYHLNVIDYNDLGEALEEEMEEAGSQVTSALLSQIGDILRSDELTFRQKMQSFGDNVRRIGEEIGHSAHVLEEAGRELCTSTQEIRQAERELLKRIPQLQDYRIFK